MKPSELVGMIKEEKPELLEKLTEKRAAALIHESLFLLREKLLEVEEGVFKVPGFGTFKVRQVVRKKGDQEITAKQIIFRAPTPKGPARD